ncbi:hypothetical protein CI109_100815 [Kwoniella shandongensis]|uniref:Uncharacterized protein n=1 Tax=Kwoniella shandongensis TaxID=1734106 RepID=A0A5M6BS09_9TREE|nr:uncharacterized protein CI109_006904 [Kwoniella shandongensis]KAA5524750.1 hypothetical protein CI109_006904 [Kwoniella shandongensis]
MQRYQPPHMRQRPPPPPQPEDQRSVQTRRGVDPSAEAGPSTPRRGITPNNPTLSSTNSTNSSRYAVRPSRKDWPSSITGVQPVLASPATDIRPMRSGAGGKVKVGEMELMQSVSRSGGDGAEGDALKDWNTQERYRQYIDERIEAHYITYTTPRHTPPKAGVRQKEELESLASIVLLFRKLREGVVASHRIDGFAIEVFESSAHFAILAHNLPQLLGALSGLVPSLYQAYDIAHVKAQSGTGKVKSAAEGDEADDLHVRLGRLELEPVRSRDRRVEFASLLLLYHLVISGRRAYFDTLMELTTPQKKRLTKDNPFADISDFAPASLVGTNVTDLRPSLNPHSHIEPASDGLPLLSIDQLDFVQAAAQSMAEETFSPLTYFHLISSSSSSGNGTVSTYERTILAWAEPGIRERAWDVLKKGYMSVGVEWAGKMLGLDTEEEVRRWVEEKGGKVEDGRVKLR